MEVFKTFRHEYKYIITYQEMLAMRKKLDEVLMCDRLDDGYMVRSLYFDSVTDNDYYDKLGGEYQRKKIRLRIYDCDSDKVKLEIKQKMDYHQLKESLVISRKDAQELIKGNYQILLSYNDKLAQKIYLIFRTGCYQPKVIIEYHRIAYITATTTRITFDFNIKKSDCVEDFFKKEPNYLSLTTLPDVVLEVKFDRLLEPYIANILSGYSARNQSFSKYMIARNI